MIPSGYQIYPFNNNVGGLKTRVSPANTPINSSSDLLNVNFDTIGAISSRLGYTRINTDALSELYCLGLYSFVTEAGSNYLVGVFSDGSSSTKIYKMDNMDGDWDDITGAVTLTASSSNYVSFTIYKNTLIGTNGVDAPWKWTGAGNAAALSISQFTYAKYVITYKERLVFFATTETATFYPHRVRWSNPATIETYSAADYTDAASGADEGITGVGILYDEVYIFKNNVTNGIKKLYYTANADTPFAIASIGEVGAISHWSICPTFINGLGRGLVYLGVDNKIRYFNGSYDSSLSDDITPTIQGFNETLFSKCYACNYESLNQVWFTFASGSSTSNNRILVLDTNFNAFLLHDDIYANVMCVAYDSSNTEYLLSAGSTGLLYRQNNGATDEGSTFNSYYYTAWLNLGDLLAYKKFGWVQLMISEVTSLTFNVGWNFDYQEGIKGSKSIAITSSADTFPFTFPISLYGNMVLGKQVRIYHTGKNKTIRLKFSCGSTGYQWKVYGFSVIAKQMGIKQV